MTDDTSDQETGAATGTGILSKIGAFFGGKPAEETAASSAPDSDQDDGDDTPEPAPVDQHLEIKVTAQTIWAEARGDNEAGMSAVADVIANRVAVARVHIEEHDGEPHPLFGNGTYQDCCKRPWQFSCWNTDDANLAKLQAVTISDPHFQVAMQIATKAVTGLLVDETKAATYYYAKSLKTPPKWAVGLEPCVTIGSQFFFNNVK